MIMMASADDSVPTEKDRIRVYRIIDRACELAVQKGPHPLDADCQCLACMTKRKKILYPFTKGWKFSL